MHLCNIFVSVSFHRVCSHVWVKPECFSQAIWTGLSLPCATEGNEEDAPSDPHSPQKGAKEGCAWQNIMQEIRPTQRKRKERRSI